jgi:hypothetical protein
MLLIILYTRKNVPVNFDHIEIFSKELVPRYVMQHNNVEIFRLDRMLMTARKCHLCYAYTIHSSKIMTVRPKKKNLLT